MVAKISLITAPYNIYIHLEEDCAGDEFQNFLWTTANYKQMFQCEVIGGHGGKLYHELESRSAGAKVVLNSVSSHSDKLAGVLHGVLSSPPHHARNRIIL